MFVSNFLIGLREGLEAALIVSIVIAFLVKANRRDLLPRLWFGVGVVVVGAFALGAILTFGPYGLSFQAQELIGGSLSIVAVGLVTWMIFWMAKTSRSLKGEIEAQLDAAIGGRGWGVVAIAIVAVAREGLETTLFVWSTIHSTSGATVAAVGAITGIATAALLGWAIYAGIVRINLSRFFFWSGALLIVVAAGVLAYGLGDLQEAGLFPGSPAYDLGQVLTSTSPLGSLLFGMFNYTPNPTWLQVLGWWAYLLVTIPLYVSASRRTTPSPHTADASTPPTPVGTAS